MTLKKKKVSTGLLFQGILPLNGHTSIEVKGVAGLF